LLLYKTFVKFAYFVSLSSLRYVNEYLAVDSGDICVCAVWLNASRRSQDDVRLKRSARQ